MKFRSKSQQDQHKTHCLLWQLYTQHRLISWGCEVENNICWIL